MTLTSNQRGSLVCLAVFLAALGIGFCALVIWLRRFRSRNVGARIIRVQHTMFVLRLRDLVFQDPHRYMNMLFLKENEWFVRKLWQEMGDACARGSVTGGVSAEGRAVAEEIADPHPVRLSDEGMSVQRVRLHDGNMLAIVRLPEPQRQDETYLIGVVLPPDESLKEDIKRARRLARFFIVNKWEGERSTDFCEWTVKGKLLTYNVGAPLDDRGFALAIEEKLAEARAKRSPMRR